MRCDAIINITIGDPTKTPSWDAELEFCTWALRERYKGKVKVFASIELRNPKDEEALMLKPGSAETAELETVLEQLHELSNKWALNPKEPGVGLYLQLHGNSFGTKPEPNTLADLVARLYQGWGLRFRKINIAACHSAGTKDGASVDSSPASVFCEKLEALLGASKDKLKNLLVTGYAAPVTLVAQPELIEGAFDAVPGEYKAIYRDEYGRLADKFAALPPFRGVHNMFEEPALKSTLLRAAVFSEDFKTLINECEQALKAKTEMEFNMLKKKLLVKLLQTTNRIAPDKEGYESFKRYLKNKFAWRYGSGSGASSSSSSGGDGWARVELEQYMDNSDVADLVGKIRAVIRATGQSLK